MITDRINPDQETIKTLVVEYLDDGDVVVTHMGWNWDTSKYRATDFWYLDSAGILHEPADNLIQPFITEFNKSLDDRMQSFRDGITEWLR